MTDYQLKTILKMVLDIAENTNDVEKIKKSLRELISGESEKKDDGAKTSRSRLSTFNCRGIIVKV